MSVTSKVTTKSRAEQRTAGRLGEGARDVVYVGVEKTTPKLNLDNWKALQSVR